MRSMRQKLLDHAKQSQEDAIKTSSKEYCKRQQEQPMI